MSGRPSPPAGGRRRGQLRLLLGRDRRRLLSALRRPTPGPWLGAALPVALVAGVLYAMGPAALPPEQGVENLVLLGVVVSAPVSFVSYGLLFRPADAAFVRLLGLDPRTMYGDRALRLLGVAAGVAALALVPYLSAGLPLARPLAVAAAGAGAAWAGALAAQAAAALAMSRRLPGQGWGCLTAGMWDREVAAAAPLVYAPVVPLLGGAAAAGAVAAGPGAGWGRLAIVLLAAALVAARAARPFALALPRFGAMVQEMAFAPPATGAGDLRVGRGVTRLLPRRAAAVWARDALVAGRRFAWATRVVWPVAVPSFFALARWGEAPGTRAWVGIGVGGALLLQGAAIVGLGRMERAGRRWIDHAVGIGWPLRLLGRWAWAWGLSLWLCLPVALAWHWWSGAGPGWPWVAAGAASAALAAGVSVAAAGAR